MFGQCLIPLFLHPARVYDIHHIVNGDRSFSDVGGDDDFGHTLRWAGKDRLLLLIGQGRV